MNKQDESIKFYRNLILNFTTRLSAIQAKKIGQVVSRPKLGSVIVYYYDAKLKDELPYWDRFPLVIPLNYYKDGYLGLNLHYLPPGAREAFFDQLLDTVNKRGTNIRAKYPLLRDLPRYSAYKVCLKRYLYTHVKSPFLEINNQHWGQMVSLPVQQFQKGRPW